MARKPSVRWNETKQWWMAWVRFPDGTRRKVERVEKADAQADLDDWFEAGCPNVAPTRNSRHARQKSPNTIANARQLLGTSVRPVIGHQWVDRTTTERLEELFGDMADRDYATSTIDRTWNYLNQPCQHAQRARRIKTNPAADVLSPARIPVMSGEVDGPPDDGFGVKHRREDPLGSLR